MKMTSFVCDWKSAFCEQLSKIQKEINIAVRNNDKSDAEKLQKWMSATSYAMRLYEDGVSIQDIPESLKSAGADLNFPECEEFFASLEEDDFEMMIDW